jgi:hypothetical protein
MVNRAPNPLNRRLAGAAIGAGISAVIAMAIGFRLMDYQEREINGNWEIHVTTQSTPGLSFLVPAGAAIGAVLAEAAHALRRRRDN